MKLQAQISIGSLVAHTYNPEELWIAANGNVIPNGKLIWRSNEIGAISLGIAVFSRGKMNIIAKDKTTNVMFNQKKFFLHFV